MNSNKKEVKEGLAKLGIVKSGWLGYILPVNRFLDDRGMLDQIYNEDLKDILPVSVKRMYIVYSPKGTIRAFHKNFNELKYFTVIKGMAKFVIVNPTTKEIVHFVLSDRKAEMLIVESDVWNGWIAMNDCILLGMATTTLAEHKDERCDPSTFGPIWRTVFR